MSPLKDFIIENNEINLFTLNISNNELPNERREVVKFINQRKKQLSKLFHPDLNLHNTNRSQWMPKVNF